MGESQIRSNGCCGDGGGYPPRVRNEYASVADFERRNQVKLPADLAEMLTPQQ